MTDENPPIDRSAPRIPAPVVNPDWPSQRTQPVAAAPGGRRIAVLQERIQHHAGKVLDVVDLEDILRAVEAITDQEMGEATGINVPDDCDFAYSVTSEAWYAPTLKANGTMKDRPELMVQAAARGGGAKWEFSIVEKTLGGPALQVRNFYDSFAAYQEIPAFFAALAEEEPRTLVEVRAILDRLGAVDKTPREHPRPVTPLPDKPGAVGTAIVGDRGRVRVHLIDAGSTLPWAVVREGGHDYDWLADSDLSDYVPLLDGDQG